MISETESDPLQRNIRLLSEITGIEVDRLENHFPIGELTAMLNDLGKLDNSLEDKKVRMTFKCGGKRFKVKWRQQELTASQYIDSTTFARSNPIEQIHNILASICVEVNWLGIEQPYDGAKHKEVSELFYNNLKIEVAYPIMLFFCKYLNELQTTTQTFLMAEVERMKADFGVSMVG